MAEYLNLLLDGSSSNLILFVYHNCGSSSLAISSQKHYCIFQQNHFVSMNFATFCVNRMRRLWSLNLIEWPETNAAFCPGLWEAELFRGDRIVNPEDMKRPAVLLGTVWICWNRLKPVEDSNQCFILKSFPMAASPKSCWSMSWFFIVQKDPGDFVFSPTGLWSLQTLRHQQGPDTPLKTTYRKQPIGHR